MENATTPGRPRMAKSGRDEARPTRTPTRPWRFRLLRRGGPGPASFRVPSDALQWTSRPGLPVLKHVCVHLCGAEVLGAKAFLDRSEVCALLQEIGCKRVSERVTAVRLGDGGRVDWPIGRLLHGRRGAVVPFNDPASGVFAPALWPGQRRMPRPTLRRARRDGETEAHSGPGSAWRRRRFDPWRGGTGSPEPLRSQTHADAQSRGA